MQCIGPDGRVVFDCLWSSLFFWGGGLENFPTRWASRAPRVVSALGLGVPPAAPLTISFREAPQ